MVTEEQQSIVLARHLRKISDYIQANGVKTPIQKRALLLLAEGWDNLSADGVWDDTLEAKLKNRPSLFDFAPAPKGEVKTKPANAAVVAATTGIYKASVKAIDLSQPDAMTCQSACIGMATGDSNIRGIRAQLDEIGTAGDPAVMGIVLKERLGDRYIYNGKASLEDMKGWLRNGEFLISHTFLTSSGHVIALDGLKDVAGSDDFFDVKDPWSEYNASTFSYDNPNVSFYDGYYSARLIYAAAVKAFSFGEAKATYASGELDSNLRGAWVHRCLPKK